MDNDELVKKKEELDKVKQEDFKIYEEFKAKLNNSMNLEDNYGKSNYLELVKDLINDYKNLNAFEKSIKVLKSDGEELAAEKAKLLASDFDIDDFIYDNAAKLMSLYFIVSLIVTDVSADTLDFIKKYLIIVLIAITSFDISSKYYQSEYHKDRVAKRVNKITYLEKSFIL